MRWIALCLTITLVACDAAQPADAGIDGGRADGGPPDAPAACADFTGSYRLAMLLDPCVRGTAIRYGVFCVAQEGCSATIFGTHGQATATASADTLSFELDGLLCTARDGGLAITCEDPLSMTSCEVSASAAPDVEGACCVRDAECASGDRCAPITHPASSPLQVVSACVASGAGALGAACATAGGVDDCGSGLTCTAGGLGDDAIECRTLCRAASDCASGEACVWYSLAVPLFGFCLPSCTLYGDECGATGTCGGVTVLDTDGALGDGLACRAVGTAEPLGTCTHATDCPANHTCARPPTGGEFACHPICGPSDPCVSAADRCLLIGTSSTPPSGACVPR